MNPTIRTSEGEALRDRRPGLRDRTHYLGSETHPQKKKKLLSNDAESKEAWLLVLGHWDLMRVFPLEI
jgi:hypothetical protein